MFSKVRMHDSDSDPNYYFPSPIPSIHSPPLSENPSLAYITEAIQFLKTYMTPDQ